MLAQEALFRCLPESEIFIAFLIKGPRPMLQGKFYVGTVTDINARDFSVPMDQANSAIVQSLESLSVNEWHAGPRWARPSPHAVWKNTFQTRLPGAYRRQRSGHRPLLYRPVERRRL